MHITKHSKINAIKKLSILWFFALFVYEFTIDEIFQTYSINRTKLDILDNTCLNLKLN